MPAQGRGANLVPRERLPPPPPAWHAPLANAPAYHAPAPAPHREAFHSGIPQQPFHAALQQTQRRVERTQRALPKQPTPYIPRVPNPTQAQSRAALTLALNHARQIGSKAAGELGQDPRNHGYLGTVQHYLNAFLGQQRAAQTGILAQGRALTSPLSLPAATLAARQQQAAQQRKEQEWRPSLPLIGTINLSKLIGAAANLHIAPGGVLGDLVNEAIDMPAQTFLSSAVAGSALREGVEKGEWKPAKTIGQGVLKMLEHPIHSTEEAPLATLLTLAGGENAVARLVGRAGRVATKGALVGSDVARLTGRAPTGLERLASALDVRRPPLDLYGGEKIVGRRYNTDPLRKAAQVAYERKILPNLPGGLRQADPFQPTGWRLDRNLVGGVTKVGRLDRMAQGSESTRRSFVRSTVEKVAGLKPEVGEHAVPLIVQGIVRRPSVVADLTKEAEKLRAAQTDLKGSSLKANKANLAHVEELLANKDFLADPSEAFKAASRYIALQKPFTAALLHGGKLVENQLRAALYPYAQAHMGARYFNDREVMALQKAGIADERAGAGLRHATGEHLSNEAILQHMAEHGVHEHGFISHKTGVAGRSSFFKSTLRQPTLERFHRTGASFAKGTADHSFEAAVGNMANHASEAAQLEVSRRRLSRLTFGGPYESAGVARAAADNFHATPEGQTVAGALGEVVPVHLGTGQILEKRLMGEPPPTSDVLRQFGLAEHTTPETSQLGHYGLIPRKVAERLTAHDKALHSDGGIGRAMQLYQQGFRRAKLNTSIPHIAGVIQEQGIRLGTEGVAPAIHVPETVKGHNVPLLGGRSVGGFAGRAGIKFSRNLAELAELDRHGVLADEHGPLGEHFREMAGTMANRGGLAGSQKANDVVRKADQWQATSMAGYVMHGAEAAGKSRAGEIIGKPWQAWKAVVEGGLAHVEHGTRDALMAKALKDSGIIPSYRHLIGMTDEAVKALIRGELTPNMADHLAQAVDDMGGNWNRQTPVVRKFVGKWAPFALWWLNSMRWLYRLPVTHPVKTAIGAALYQATREQRNKKGQGYDAAHPVPNFLQGTIDATLPVVGRVKVNPSYYSPGGTGGPEAAKIAAEQFGPAFSGPYAAAQPINPLSDEKLKGPHGEELKAPEILKNVIGEAVANPIPFATQLQKISRMGGKPYGTANFIGDIQHLLGGPSQVKPGTERPLSSVLVKLLSPARFDFPGKQKGGKGGAYGPPISTSGMSPRQQLQLSRTRRSSSGLSARQELQLARRR